MSCWVQFRPEPEDWKGHYAVFLERRKCLMNRWFLHRKCRSTQGPLCHPVGLLPGCKCARWIIISIPVKFWSIQGFCFIDNNWLIISSIKVEIFRSLVLMESRKESHSHFWETRFKKYNNNKNNIFLFPPHSANIFWQECRRVIGTQWQKD